MSAPSAPGAPEIRLSLADPRAALVLALALALIALPAFGDGYLVGLATKVVILAIAAASLDLILGYGGMVSFGHAAFLGVGAYAVAIWAVQGVESAAVHFATAVAASALIGLVVGALSLRTGGLYFIMITFAFAQMLFYLGVSLEPLGGDDGVNIKASRVGGMRLTDSLLRQGPESDGLLLYYVSLAALFATVVFLRTLVGSRFGFVLRGARSNETRMQAIGFPTFRYRLAAFTIAGTLCGVAGALLANAQQFVSPSYMGWLRSGELLVMVILGGLGTIYGSVVGAVSLIALEELLIVHAGKDYWMMVLGPVLVAVVVFARQGLLSLVPATWGEVPRFAWRLALVLAGGAAFVAALRWVPAWTGASPLHVILWPLGLLAAWKLWRGRRRPAAKARPHG